MRNSIIFLVAFLLIGMGVPHAYAELINMNVWKNTPIAVSNSNGATPVSLVSGTAVNAGHATVIVELNFNNTDTAAHQVYILDGTTQIHSVEIPAGSPFALDNPLGILRTTPGNNLQFKCDSGAGMAVHASGAAIQ